MQAVSASVIEERVGGLILKVQRFFDRDVFKNVLMGEDFSKKIEELEARAKLLKEVGLETAARLAAGELAYYRYCRNKDADPDVDFGAPLTNKQKKILLEKFPIAYKWGFHSRYGNVVAQHLKNYGYENTSDWTWDCGEEGKVPFKVACWKAYNFETIPTSILEKIRVLQGNPLVQQTIILAPEKALKDPVLLVDCYKLGLRLVARWSEALEPIKGLDF